MTEETLSQKTEKRIQNNSLDKQITRMTPIIGDIEIVKDVKDLDLTSGQKALVSFGLIASKYVIESAVAYTIYQLLPSGFFY